MFISFVVDSNTQTNKSTETEMHDSNMTVRTKNTGGIPSLLLLLHTTYTTLMIMIIMAK